MVASHPSTSANPVERQNARCRHPLNNEALGFYACLTSPHERSFSVAIGERNSRICSDGFRLSPRDALGILQMIPRASVEPLTSNFNCVRAFLERCDEIQRVAVSQFTLSKSKREISLSGVTQFSVVYIRVCY